MKKSCGLCIDNVAAHTLEVRTGYGTTGTVQVCWPCLQTRMEKLVSDLHPGRDVTHFGDITEITVTTP